MFHKSDFEAQWESIYMQYGPVLYNYGCKLTHQHQLAEDCIQDLFAALWEKKSDLHSIRHIKAYLIKAFRRKLLQKLQTDQEHKASQSHNMTEPQFHISFSFEASLIDIEVQEEQKVKLEKALQQLTPRQREAIFLKFYENHSYDEVADIMSIEKSALYSLVYKAMSQLRGSLKQNTLTTANAGFAVLSLCCLFFLPML